MSVELGFFFPPSSKQVEEATRIKRMKVIIGNSNGVSHSRRDV